MGVKTDEYLSGLFADSFKREVDADEAVWRSLPFFAALLGLALATLPSIFRSVADVAGFGWRTAIYALFAASLFLFTVAGYWFARVIWPRNYRYPPYDAEILSYAESLREFHERRGTKEAERDELIRDELRKLVIEEFAAPTAVNRRNNGAKSVARTQVLLFAMSGFLLAFLSEATILAAQAFAPRSQTQVNGDSRGRGTGSAGPAQEAAGSSGNAQADAAAASHRPGGRQLLPH